MRFAKWLGGSVVIVGAVLSAWLSSAGAASGDAIYVVRKAPVVLSAAQKTSAGSWAKSVWPGIVAANLSAINCDHVPTITGSGLTATVDFAGAWECVACDVYSPTAAEKLDAELDGRPLSNGQRCLGANVADGTLTAAQAGAAASFARDLVGAGAQEIVGSLRVARTPGQPTRVTAEVGVLVVASPAVWDAARSKGDQPGGVVKTWGRVQ